MKRTILFLCLIPFISGCPSLGGGDSGGDGSGDGTTGLGSGSTEPPGDTGTEVVSLSQNPLSSICQRLTGEFFLGSPGGKALRSSDGDAFTVLDGTAIDVNDAFCDQTSTSTTSVTFVGDGGTILTYNGTAMTTETSNTTSDLNSIAGSDFSNLYAAGDGGLILHFDGSTWNTETSSTTENLYGVTMASAQLTSDVYAVGSNRTVLKRTNPSGGVWSAFFNLPVEVLTDTKFNAIWRDPASGELFVVGNAGTIMKGTTGGGTWVKQNSGTSLDLLAVQGSSNSQVFAVGKDGVILSYDGVAWTKLTSPTTSILFDVLAISSTSAFAVGAESTSSDATGTILEFTASGWTKL